MRRRAQVAPYGDTSSPNVGEADRAIVAPAFGRPEG